MDETWVFHHDPESKKEAKEWCEPGTSAPKRLRVQKSVKKVLASVFQLDAKIREKGPGLQNKKILFHQDNAPADTAQKTITKITEISTNCCSIHLIRLI